MIVQACRRLYLPLTDANVSPLCQCDFVVIIRCVVLWGYKIGEFIRPSDELIEYSVIGSLTPDLPSVEEVNEERLGVKLPRQDPESYCELVRHGFKIGGSR